MHSITALEPCIVLRLLAALFSLRRKKGTLNVSGLFEKHRHVMPHPSEEDDQAEEADSEKDDGGFEVLVHFAASASDFDFASRCAPS